MVSTNLIGCRPKRGCCTAMVLRNRVDCLGKPLESCTSNEIETYGRDLACSYLEKTGLVVIDRGWHSLVGNADIVARDGAWGVLVDVRVRKARTDNAGVRKPMEIVIGNRSRRHYEECTICYFASHAQLTGVRFDVIALDIRNGYDAKLSHFVGASVYQ